MTSSDFGSRNMVREMRVDSHRNTIGWMIHYLDSNNLGAAARSVERHSGLYFNFRHFEDSFIGGDLDEADNYLSGFTSVDENSFSTLLFFAIRWHKFLQALDLNQRQRARRILREELRAHRQFNNCFTADPGHILRLRNFRDGLDGDFEDLGLARLQEMEDVRDNLEANPSLKGKIVFPPSLAPPTLAVLPPPVPTPLPNEAYRLALLPVETRGLTIQPLPAPSAALLQLSGVRHGREEEMEHGRHSRLRLHLVPANEHPQNLGYVAEAPDRN